MTSYPVKKNNSIDFNASASSDLDLLKNDSAVEHGTLEALLDYDTEERAGGVNCPNHLLVLVCTITLHSTLELDFTGQNQSTATSVHQQTVENTTRDGPE